MVNGIDLHERQFTVCVRGEDRDEIETSSRNALPRRKGTECFRTRPGSDGKAGRKFGLARDRMGTRGTSIAEGSDDKYCT